MELTSQTNEELVTYGPLSLVQNQPENQMDILLAGGAYETLQCTNEQIWPWIIEAKGNWNLIKGFWECTNRTRFSFTVEYTIIIHWKFYKKHQQLTCSIKLRTAKAGLGKPWAEVALCTPPEIGVLKSPALVPPPDPPGVVIVDHDISIGDGSYWSSSELSEWVKFSFRMKKAPN